MKSSCSNSFWLCDSFSAWDIGRVVSQAGLNELESSSFFHHLLIGGCFHSFTLRRVFSLEQFVLAGVPIETLIEEIVRMKDRDQVELFLLVLVSALEELIAGDLIVTVIGLFLDLVDVNLLDAPVAKLLLQVSLVLERTTLVLSFNGQRFDLCRTSVGSCTKRKLPRRK